MDIMPWTVKLTANGKWHHIQEFVDSDDGQYVKIHCLVKPQKPYSVGAFNPISCKICRSILERYMRTLTPLLRPVDYDNVPYEGTRELR